MTTTDKYLMLKNLIHNELGISKDEIKLWIQESVDEYVSAQMKRFIEEGRLNKRVDSICRDMVEKSLSANAPGGTYKVRELVAGKIFDAIQDQIEFSYKVKSNTSCGGEK